MGEDEPFIAAVEADPTDDAARLVYADWLDERGDPRGEYLRAELRLAADPSGPDAVRLRGRLRALRAGIDPGWLARFDQPRVMRANPTPFPAGWWGVELPGVREFDATYRCFPYDSLPPLPAARLRGDLSWLRSAPADGDAGGGWSRTGGKVAAMAAQLGLPVPPAFLSAVTDPGLRGRVRSCTDCYFTLSPVVALSNVPSGHLIRFYSDSQDCLHWYLYLTPGGYHAVVVSGERYCGDWSDLGPDDEPQVVADLDGVWFCGPSIEAFLYRWWLENTIWHKLADAGFDFHDPTPLAMEEQAYIDFYRRHPPAPAT